MHIRDKKEKLYVIKFNFWKGKDPKLSQYFGLRREKIEFIPFDSISKRSGGFFFQIELIKIRFIQ